MKTGTGTVQTSQSTSRGGVAWGTITENYTYRKHTIGTENIPYVQIVYYINIELYIQRIYYTYREPTIRAYNYTYRELDIERTRHRYCASPTNLRFPRLIEVLEFANTGRRLWVHLIVGDGLPEALHCSSTSFDSATVTFWGRSVITGAGRLSTSP